MGFFGCPVQGQVLDSMILMDPFQLSIFYDSVKESEEQTGYWPRWFSAFGHQQNTSVPAQENLPLAAWEEDSPTEGMEGAGSPHYTPTEAPPG